MVLETGCWLFEMFRAGWGSFLFGGFLGEGKEKWVEAYMEVEVLGNVCPKAKNGVLTPIIYIFYSKNSCKTAI